VTNTVNIRAIMAYLKEQGVDMQPYIDAELAEREAEAKKMAEQREKLQKQAVEQLKAAQEEPPPAEDADAPLVFGGDVEVREEGEADVVRERSDTEEHQPAG
jgi:hypothetical protein